MRPEWGGLKRQFGNAVDSSTNRISKFKYGHVKDGDARKTIAGSEQRSINQFES